MEMSMETDKIERLRERILVCSICIDEYKDPRMLPCHHSVCMQCLLDYVRTSSSGRVFRCPQCRADVCVPRGGIKDFPPNFYINCIQDELGSKPYFGVCDVCEHDWLVSQYRCVDCDLDICKFCIHEHRLFRHNGTKINIMRIETGNLSANLTSEKSCGTHKEEMLQMFCCSCETPVCVMCVCEEHKHHVTMPLAKKLNNLQKLLQFKFDDLKSEVRKVNKVLTTLDDLSENMRKNCEDVTKCILDQAQTLTQTIEKIANFRVKEISANGDKTEDVSSYTRELRCYVDQLEKGASFLEDLQEGDMSLELLECYKKYQNGLEVMKKATTNKRIHRVHYNFEPGKHFEKFNFFGAHFGSLQKTTVTDSFFSDKKPGFNLGKKWHPGRFLTVNTCMYLAVHCSVLLGIWRLAVSLFTNEGAAIETMFALVFCIYLMVASWFAFNKRQPGLDKVD